MTLLIDTHILIWSAQGPERVPQRARDAIEAAERRAFSVVSLWEVAIKHALGRPDFPFEAARLRDGLLANGYAELPVLGHHALAVADLPRLHGDPFDRLLVAQTRAEGLTFLTADRALAAYGGPIRLV